MLARRSFLASMGAIALGSLAACTSYLPQGSTAPDQLTRVIVTQKVNALRAAYGRAPLAYDNRLATAAQHQANLMAQKDTLSHDLGETLRQRVAATGYEGAVGEDVAAGQQTLEEALASWMKSAPHQHTLLNEKFTGFGLGVAKVSPGSNSRYGIYWAIILGGEPVLWLRGPT